MINSPKIVIIKVITDFSLKIGYGIPIFKKSLNSTGIFAIILELSPMRKNNYMQRQPILYEQENSAHEVYA